MQISGPSEPPAGEVHVWHGRVFGEPTSDDIAVLADAERARSARLRRPGDRARFVAVHAAQRRLLARYLSTDPAAIRFGRSRCCQCGSSEHGRPNIEWPPTELSHNLSRSGDHWLLAVGVGSQVGVDIECHRDIELDRMAEACLTESERGYLKDQPDELRQQVFFRCWTRKEAVLKACGVGLATRLSSLEVHPEQSGPVEVRHVSGSCPDTWLVQDLAPGPPHDQAPGVAKDPSAPAWSAAVARPAGPHGQVRFLACPPL
jgi:4'-phosphopantetheinyl transferase